MLMLLWLIPDCGRSHRRLQDPSNSAPRPDASNLLPPSAPGTAEGSEVACPTCYSKFQSCELLHCHGCYELRSDMCPQPAERPATPVVQEALIPPVMQNSEKSPVSSCGRFQLFSTLTALAAE